MKTHLLRCLLAHILSGSLGYTPAGKARSTSREISSDPLFWDMSSEPSGQSPVEEGFVCLRPGATCHQCDQMIYVDTLIYGEYPFLLWGAGVCHVGALCLHD